MTTGRPTAGSSATSPLRGGRTAPARRRPPQGGRVSQSMRAGPILAGLGGLLVLAAATEAMVAAGGLSSLIVPRPSDVLEATGTLIASGQLGAALATTLYESGAACLAAIVLGVGTGYLLYRYTVLGRAYESWFAALFAAPTVLLYPLFLVIFGRSTTTIIVMGVIDRIRADHPQHAARAHRGAAAAARRRPRRQLHGRAAVLESSVPGRRPDRVRRHPARHHLHPGQRHRHRVPDQFRRPRLSGVGQLRQVRHSRACTRPSCSSSW